MANDNINLNLEIKSSGASGVTRQVKQISGSLAEVDEKLKRISLSGKGLNNNLRKQLGDLRKLINEAAKSKDLDKISAKLGGKKGTSISLKEYDPAKVAAQQARERLRIEKQTATQLATIRKQEMAKELTDRKAHMGFLRALDKEDLNKKILFQNKLRSVMGTLGFAGMNVGQQLAGLFQNVNFIGMLSGPIGAIGEAIGGIFNATFGNIFGNLLKGFGSFGESIVQVMFTPIKMAFKMLGNFISGVSIGIITAIYSGFNPIIGLFAGLGSAIIGGLNVLMESAISIFKGLMESLASIAKAGLELIRATFETIGNIIKASWTGLWETLKAVSIAAMDAIKTGVTWGLEQVSKGFTDYVTSQKSAIKAAIQVEDVFRKQGVGFDEANESVRTLINSLRTDFGLAQAQAAEGAYYALSSNFRTLAEATQVLNESAKLAVTYQEDFNEVTRTTANILNAYNLGAEGAERVTRALASGTALGSFQMKDLLASLGTVIASAAKVNVPIETLIGSISALSLGGVNAYKATVGLNRIFGLMLSPTKGAAKEMKKLGINSKEFTSGAKDFPALLAEITAKMPEEELRDIFPTEQARRSFLGIMSDFGRFKGIVGKTGDVDLNAQFEEVKKTISFLIPQIQELYSVIRDNLIKPLAIAFTPVFQFVSDSLKNIKAYLEKIDFTKFAQNAFNIFTNIINIIGNIPAALNEAYGIFGSIESVATYIFDEVINPVLKALQDPGTYASLIVGFEKAFYYAKWIKDVFSELFFSGSDKFVNNFNIIFNVLKKGFLIVGKFVASILIDAFSIAIDFFVSTIGSKIKFAFLDAISAAFGQLYDFTMKKQQALINAGEKDAAQVLNPFTGLFHSMKSMGEFGGAVGLDILNDSIKNLRDFTAPNVSGEQNKSNFDIAIMEPLKALIGEIRGGGWQKTAIGSVVGNKNNQKILADLTNFGSLEDAIREQAYRNTPGKMPTGVDFDAAAKQVKDSIGYILTEVDRYLSSPENKKLLTDEQLQVIQDFSSAVRSGREQYVASEKMYDKIPALGEKILKESEVAFNELLGVFKQGVADLKTENTSFNTKGLDADLAKATARHAIITAELSKKFLDAAASAEKVKRANELEAASKNRPTTSTGNFASITKTVPVGQASSTYSSLTRNNPKATVERIGTIRTSKGNQAVFEIKMPEETLNKMQDATKKGGEKADQTSVNQETQTKALLSLEEKAKKKEESDKRVEKLLSIIGWNTMSSSARTSMQLEMYPDVLKLLPNVSEQN